MPDPSNPVEDCQEIESSSIKKYEQDSRKSSLPKNLNFKCHVEGCDAAYRKRWLLEDHIRKHNKERPFVCTAEECSKSFTKESHLKRHQVMVHEKACEQICDIEGCGRVFNNKYSLKKHKNKVHIETENSFFCSECPKEFKKKWKLNQHMYVHTGEPSFKCTICNLGFTLVRDFTKHNKNHKTYTCECGEDFERWSLLRRHKKDACKHIDKNCKHCGRKFTNKNNLRSHYKICTTTKECLQCPYLGCTRNYLYKRNLNWHISNTHEKDKTEVETFKCPEQGCERDFLKKCFLNRHLKKSHSEKCKPKPKELRKIRKDKGKPKSYMAATLSGIELSQKEHIALLNGNDALLTTVMLQTQLNTSKAGFVETSSKNDDGIKKHWKLINTLNENQKEDAPPIEMLLMDNYGTSECSEPEIAISDEHSSILVTECLV